MKGWMATRNYSDQFGSGVAVKGERGFLVPQPKLRVNKPSDKPWLWYVPEMSEMYVRGVPEGTVFGFEAYLQGDRYCSDPEWFDDIYLTLEPVATDSYFSYERENRAHITAVIPLPASAGIHRALTHVLGLISSHMTERKATEEELDLIYGLYSPDKREQAGDIIGDFVIWDMPELYEPVENLWKRDEHGFQTEIDGKWVKMSATEFTDLREYAYETTGSRLLTTEIVEEYRRNPPVQKEIVIEWPEYLIQKSEHVGEKEVTVTEMF